MTECRTETDSLGPVDVPADALYGAQTQRAIGNFALSGLTMPPLFIHSLARLKAAAARVNADLDLLDRDRAEAIIRAAETVAAGGHDDQFPVDVFQTGSGTSTHMNMNEVLARLASDDLGKDVHPNNHVNRSQSSNDVIPTVLRMSVVVAAHDTLLPGVQHLREVIVDRARTLADVVKTGRTHLMDAMPVTFGQELSGWAAQIESGYVRIAESLDFMSALPIGGTAVGTGLNAHPEFGKRVAGRLTTMTGHEFSQMENLFEGLSSQDATLHFSGALRTLSVSLTKIANDLRWMNSGPNAGLAEIELPALQPGSSIMPGKVNPVAAEAVTLACAHVAGNDLAVMLGAQSGNFQLNLMLPMIAYNVLQSIDVLGNAARLIADSTLMELEVNHENVDEALSHNPVLITALTPLIGYEKGAEIARAAFDSGRPVQEVAAEMTDLSDRQLAEALDPLALTKGGIREITEESG